MVRRRFNFRDHRPDRLGDMASIGGRRVITMEKKKQFVCSICGKLASGWSCNAAPVNDGRCCGDCDRFIVIPHRIRALTRRQKEVEVKEQE
jgi:hypothetical protein